MTKLYLNEAKERLPELLDKGAKGEDIVIIDGDGASYKITVTALDESLPVETPSTEDNPPLSRLRGAGKGLFSSAEEVDTYIRGLRDEWES